MDLEWNSAYDAKMKKYLNEIIEIGAVKLDENRKMIDTFRVYIKPQICKKLNSHVRELTQLECEDLALGLKFHDAFRQFQKWVGPDAVILTWGMTDISVLMENFRRFTDTDRPGFLKRYCDLQLYCQKAIGADLSRQIGLSAAAQELGINCENFHMHSALDDSIVSSLCFDRVFFPETFARAVRPVNDEFYKRMAFKVVILSDIHNPLVDKSKMKCRCENCGKYAKRTGTWKFKNRAFRCKFFCERCGIPYQCAVQFKLKYDEVVVKKSVTCTLNDEAEAEKARAADATAKA